MHSTLAVHDVALDLLTLTATARGVSSAECGQSPLEVPIDLEHVSAKIRLWPLMDEVAGSGVTVRPGE
jgi:hypothetical protein